MLEKLGKNDELMGKDVGKLRERCEILMKEKEYYEKELERVTGLYELKLDQMREQNDLRVNVLESTMKSHKEDFNATEDKAFEMLKKQENVKKEI